MRTSATLITALYLTTSALALTACNPQPLPTGSMREALNKLSGPKVEGVDKNLKAQAEKAESAGDFKRASQMYQQLVDEHPDDKEYVVALGDSLRRSGSSQGALKALNPYITAHPDDADALEVKGLAQMGVGDLTEATKTFDTVMKINGKRWRTLNAIGIMFASRNQQPQAIAYYNAALEASPDNPGVLNNLGLSQAMQKDYDASIASFMKARSHLDSNNPQQLRHVDLDLALVYALAGRLEDAEATAGQHLNKAELYNNMGFYAYISKNGELAKAYLNMALSQDPAYYERAWKNLNAISGENASESNASQEDSPKARRVTVPKSLSAAPAAKSAPGKPSADQSMFVEPGEKSVQAKAPVPVVTAKPVEAPKAVEAKEAAPAAPAAEAAPAVADVQTAPAQQETAAADTAKKDDSRAEGKEGKSFLSNFSGMFNNSGTAAPVSPKYPGMKTPRNEVASTAPVQAEKAAPDLTAPPPSTDSAAPAALTPASAFPFNPPSQ